MIVLDLDCVFQYLTFLLRRILGIRVKQATIRLYYLRSDCGVSRLVQLVVKSTVAGFRYDVVYFPFPVAHEAVAHTCLW